MWVDSSSLGSGMHSYSPARAGFELARIPILLMSKNRVRKPQQKRTVRFQNLIGRSRIGPRVVESSRVPKGLSAAGFCHQDEFAASLNACPLRAQTGRQMRLGAAPCGFLAGILRLFGVLMNVANVDVAGSSPVSCSRFRERPRPERSGAFMLLRSSESGGDFWVRLGLPNSAKDRSTSSSQSARA